ncbi:alpha/beta fold hydrolase [Segnochrobactrum spirostomi]|uniref:Alpha/beta fold hydrolase n=1 Tax=Segnochrobactrum spirostomi TaxID=2608987 RepID=A0A6A7YAI2_9HYPH|nr:alpha/beta fold hydrolase [Segnochrobactrum spirostomi]MQT14672.1 alpha/beta fold hydrolase [Segnochrobactrum spirostomi]
MTSTTLLRSRTRRGAAYQEAGAGEPLVLIHGVGLRLEAWQPQIAYFAATHRVIAVDMPGHGGSAPLEAGAALPAFVKWLGDVLDDLALDAVNLAGHSMGALIAGGAAAEFGARIRRVALLNGVYRRDPAARAAVVARAREIAAGHRDVEGPLQRWFDDDAADPATVGLVRLWLSSVDPAGYATAYGAFAEGDAVYADAWPRVACPALFLTGDGDPNSTPAMAEAMAALAPNGRAVIVEGHRHMVNLTAPERVNAALADWLRS